MRRLSLCTALVLGLSSLFSLSAEAQSLIPSGGVVGSCNFRTGVLHFDCIPVYIGYLITVAFGFAGGTFLIGIMMGGYKFAVGSVTTEGKEAGKKQLIGAITGFAVVVLSYLLIDTILEALL